MTPYETATDYGKRHAADVANQFIAAGLGDRLFDIPSFKLAQSTLADLLTNAYISGMLEAQRRLTSGAEESDAA